MRHVNPHARVAVCGLIASYNGVASTLPDMRTVLVMQVKIQGFILPDDEEIWSAALAELVPLVASGALRYRETIAEGLESAPEAFIGLLAGRNVGKQVVRLG
jgi:NADPH-dependent curcumin reductase CurA